MAEIPGRRKKSREETRETNRKKKKEHERKKEREREREGPATVRYFLIDVDIWKTLRRTSMHQDNAMCLAYLEGASCIGRFIVRSFSTSSSILVLESFQDSTIPTTRTAARNLGLD